MKTKILYIEDELPLAKITKESLERRGYAVFHEEDGTNVHAQFLNLQPNICIIDIMLPFKNGYEVATEIRKISQQVPIIFLTAKTQSVDVVKGFKTGCNDYIRKPFSLEELIARIENALKIPQTNFATEEATLCMGKFTFDVHRQTLTNGNEVKLSYKECDLLKYLYEYRNSVITRKEILKHIWGSDSFFNSRTLDVYINKLRSYFKNDTSIEIITVKGVGYRFVF